MWKFGRFTTSKRRCLIQEGKSYFITFEYYTWLLGLRERISETVLKAFVTGCHYTIRKTCQKKLKNKKCFFFLEHFFLYLQTCSISKRAKNKQNDEKTKQIN